MKRTNQQIFDLVCKSLIEQGAPSVDKNSTSYSNPACMYRSHDGMKCAAGFLIPDDEYNPEMEGSSVEDLYYDEVEAFRYFDHNNIDLIQTLQNLHDRASAKHGILNKRFVDDFKEGAKDVAERFNLNVSVLLD